jgi:hypothetical protein
VRRRGLFIFATLVTFAGGCVGILGDFSEGDGSQDGGVRHRDAGKTEDDASGADAKHPLEDAGKDGRPKRDDGGPDAPTDGATTNDATTDGASTDSTSTDVVQKADAPGSDAPVYAEAPRQISPLSTSRVTSHTPTFTWTLPTGVTGATLDVCTSRACTTADSAYHVGTSYKLAQPLAVGVHYWRVRPEMATTPASPVWQFTVGAISAGTVDTSWGTTLDVDGDGCADIAIGAGDDQLSGPGHVYLYAGSTSGFPASNVVPTNTLTGPSTGSAFGSSVASAGDINGDGYSDLIIGAYGVANATGAVYIYLGGPGGLASTAAAVVSGPDGSGGSFGQSVASAGDVNGDGYADVIIGAPGATMFTGKAYVYFGGPVGATGAMLTLGHSLLGSAGTYTEFGASVASAGDVNGDGFPDLLVGAYEAASDNGQAYLYMGGVSFPGTPVTLTGPVANGFFGRSVAGAGDVNGDGYAEVVVGAYGGTNFTGAAYVYSGSSTGLKTTPLTLASPGSESQYGLSVASAGDVNGDGYGDVVVGADGANSEQGGVYVYLGSSMGLATAPAASPDSAPVGAYADGYFGSSVASAGNVTCGTYSSLIVGAPGALNLVGAAYLFLGGSSGLSYNQASRFNAPDGGGDFGETVFGATH